MGEQMGTGQVSGRRCIKNRWGQAKFRGQPDGDRPSFWAGQMDKTRWKTRWAKPDGQTRCDSICDQVSGTRWGQANQEPDGRNQMRWGPDGRTRWGQAKFRNQMGTGQVSDKVHCLQSVWEPDGDRPSFGQGALLAIRLCLPCPVPLPCVPLCCRNLIAHSICDRLRGRRD